MVDPSRKGFTLVELLVAMSVLAILISIATPSFSTMLARNKLLASRNDIVNALQFARHESVRTNSAIVVCPSLDGKTCKANPGNGHWRNYWLVQDHDTAELLHVGKFGADVYAIPEGVFHDLVIFGSAGRHQLRIPPVKPGEDGRLSFCHPRARASLDVIATGGTRMYEADGTEGIC